MVPDTDLPLTIKSVIPAAPGWWVLVMTENESGAPNGFLRDPVAAFAEVADDAGYHGLEAMIASEGPGAVMAREVHPHRQLILVGPEHACNCKQESASLPCNRCGGWVRR